MNLYEFIYELSNKESNVDKAKEILSYLLSNQTDESNDLVMLDSRSCSMGLVFTNEDSEALIALASADIDQLEAEIDETIKAVA